MALRLLTLVVVHCYSCSPLWIEAASSREFLISFGVIARRALLCFANNDARKALISANGSMFFESLEPLNAKPLDHAPQRMIKANKQAKRKTTKEMRVIDDKKTAPS